MKKEYDFTIKETIENYMVTNLKYFDLEGVELSKEDFDFALKMVKEEKTIEDACDEVLRGIRNCLDDGLKN